MRVGMLEVTRLVSALVVALTVACKNGDDGGTQPTTQTYTLAVASGTITAAPGGTATQTVNHENRRLRRSCASPPWPPDRRTAHSTPAPPATVNPDHRRQRGDRQRDGHGERNGKRPDRQDHHVPVDRQRRIGWRVHAGREPGDAHRSARSCRHIDREHHTHERLRRRGHAHGDWSA